MAKVEVTFEVELPFWLRMKDGKYDILIDGKNWPIYLFNDKWRVEMDNVLDGSGELTALPSNVDQARKIHEKFKNKRYYHKEKLKTVLNTGFGWNIPGNGTKEEAKKKVKKEFNWCKRTLLRQTNRFIELYRNTIEDPLPYNLGYFDLSKNWWYSILLNGKWIEGNKIVYSPDFGSPTPLINDSIQKKIANELKTDHSPPLWTLLFKNAVSLHYVGKYRTSYIEIVTAFEIFLTNFLEIKFREKNLEEALIGYLLKKSDFGFLLKDGLEIAIGNPFHEIVPNLWKKWQGEGKVLNLRNDIIHRGIDVTEKQSQNAIRVINSMIVEITKR